MSLMGRLPLPKRMGKGDRLLCFGFRTIIAGSASSLPKGAVTASYGLRQSVAGLDTSQPGSLEQRRERQ